MYKKKNNNDFFRSLGDIISESLIIINSLRMKSNVMNNIIILYNLLFSLPNKSLSAIGLEIFDPIDNFKLVDGVSTLIF